VTACPSENALDALLIPQLRLLQLASPALPVGAFSYSQGLEAAAEAGVVTNAADTERWIATVLMRFQARSEAPLWLLAFKAFAAANEATLKAQNEFYIASRETAAWRDETRQMGWSLAQLALRLDWLETGQRACVVALGRPAYPLMFAGCAEALKLPAIVALSAYLFAWLEGQCVVAQKILPIGQSAAQEMLFRLAEGIPSVVQEAVKRAALGLPAVETFAPRLGILAARHESQYSKMFRS
jgi:urease accessory protein